MSRADRIGDLILTLPAIAHLKKHSGAHISLHCSDYTKDIAEWAVFNKICDDYFCGVGEIKGGYDIALSFFHNQEMRKLIKASGAKFSMGPRPKLSALWSYTRSVAQHRSRVEKSEMHYNLDLADALLLEMGIQDAKFTGLPALKVPQKWESQIKASKYVVNLSNAGSASNWPVSEYLEWVETNTGKSSVDFLVVGNDAAERKELLKRWPKFDSKKHKIIEAFPTLKELIAYMDQPEFVLSSSTGALHLAHALGKDCLGVYPTKKVESFKRWRPDGYWHNGELRFVEI